MFDVQNPVTISKQKIINSPNSPEQCRCTNLWNTTHLILLVR